MKEALGTSMVFNFVMIFIAVFIAMIIGSLAYTKGFKVRNRIIDRIDEYKGDFDAAQETINSDLASIGYRIASEEVDCPERNGQPGVKDNHYNYCVYEYTTSKGNYYGITVFIHFDVPLVGRYINIPIYGESRVIIERDKVEN